jgi:ribosome-associated heat shock protein Hsp15
MPEEKFPRADKFLWSVRLFKTRSIAGEACTKGRVWINGIQIKPSRLIKPDDTLEVNKPPVLYTYKVNALPAGRVSAKLVSEFVIDITSPEELKKLDYKDNFFIKRDQGRGRPTKKERRLIDKLGDN